MANALPPVLWADDLRRLAAEPMRWVWHGYLAAGAVTLLTSRWKAGKTTLLAALLRHLGPGGDLGGRAVAAGRAAVVSEESPELWAARGERRPFGPHVCWLCRPFRGKPSPAEWLGLIDRLTDLQTRHGLTLVAIDPLASFLPGSDENNAAAVLAALAPLQRLTSAGAAVLLLHHPRKADGQPRGSGALSGFADVLIELDAPARGVDEERRRRLTAASRFDATPAVRWLELSADGCDYAAVADAAADEFAAGWAVLRGVLEDARHKRSRKELWAGWPEDHDRPVISTLGRWLEWAVAAGLVARSGTGRKNAPYRYWLPGRTFEFDELPPLDELPLVEARTLRACAAEVLRRRGIVS